MEYFHQKRICIRIRFFSVSRSGSSLEKYRIWIRVGSTYQSFATCLRIFCCFKKAAIIPKSVITPFNGLPMRGFDDELIELKARNSSRFLSLYRTGPSSLALSHLPPSPFVTFRVVLQYTWNTVSIGMSSCCVVWGCGSWAFPRQQIRCRNHTDLKKKVFIQYYHHHLLKKLLQKKILRKGINIIIVWYPF